jgi:formylglycine-generating enzyme required for sulfatase activity
VKQVSWDDCRLVAYAAGLRLPSEAEWEYACRAGTTTKYFWAVPHRRTGGSGDEMDDSYCWYKGNSESRTHAVTEHTNKANAFGLVDMSGHVWEWCEDQWIGDYKNGPYDSLPRTSNSPYRVLRGGCWLYGKGNCRSAFRFNYAPENRFHTVGFRVARTFD